MNHTIQYKEIWITNLGRLLQRDNRIIVGILLRLLSTTTYSTVGNSKYEVSSLTSVNCRYVVFMNASLNYKETNLENTSDTIPTH